MSFRRAFGIALFAAGCTLVINSIALRYAAWAGGVSTSPFAYWFDITLTESWAWVTMLVVGLCILIADDFEQDAIRQRRLGGKGGTIG